MTIDPVTGWGLVKGVGEAMKKLYDVAKELKDRDAKRKVDEVVDELTDLKRRAVELEDENRTLREQLRFKSEDFEFKTPFWFENAHPERALCPKCFAQKTIAPMAEPYEGASGKIYRQCLHCETRIDVEPGRRPPQREVGGGYDGPSGPNSWMAR